jgi:hypothetical protein
MFKSYELNYDTYDKELLAIMCVLEEWQSLFLGGDQPFKILTDNWNLIYYKDPHKLTKRQAHWSTILQDYDFTIKHVPGNANEPADVLSRREDEPPQEVTEGSVFKEGA